MDQLIYQVVGGVILIVISFFMKKTSDSMVEVSKNVFSLSNRISILETNSSNNTKWLEAISEDVKLRSGHDSIIAVLNKDLQNAQKDIMVMMQKMNQIESRELERYAANPLHRRL